MDTSTKATELRIKVFLDEENIPIGIDWDADDKSNNKGPVPCKAMLVSLFDRESLDTLKLDLWTKDMQVNEMDRFFFQTLRGLADTYYQATQNKDLAIDMQRFVTYFGEKTEVIEKQSQS